MRFKETILLVRTLLRRPSIRLWKDKGLNWSCWSRRITSSWSAWTTQRDPSSKVNSLCKRKKARAHSVISEAVHHWPNEFHTRRAWGEHTKLITEAESLRWGFYLLMPSPLLHDPSVGKAGPNTPAPPPGSACTLECLRAAFNTEPSCREADMRRHLSFLSKSDQRGQG